MKASRINRFTSLMTVAFMMSGPAFALNDLWDVNGSNTAGYILNLTNTTVTVSAGTLTRAAAGDNDSSASIVNGGTLILANTAAKSTSRHQGTKDFSGEPFLME